MLYRLLCAIGLHNWIRGHGWIDIGGGNEKYHDGHRCSTCGIEKNGPSRNA